jgi:pimeloyl-ACP methyl ester carboxylesterase
MEPLTRSALAERFGAELDIGPDCVLVAESYSGALAVRLAAEHRIAGLVLCNSFVAPPRHPVLRILAIPAFFRLSPPRAVIRHFLVGPTAGDDLVNEVASAIARVPPHVFAARLTEVMTEDVGAWMQRCSGPVLYLRGTEDLLIPEASMERIHALCRAEMVSIPGPHFLLQVAPDAAWAAIDRFVTERAAAEQGAAGDVRPGIVPE